MLRHVADQRPGVHIVVGLRAHHLGGASCWLKQSQKELDGCALACAVGAEETSNTFTDCECDAVEGEDSTVALCETGRFQKGG